ncbi:unnamed protein product [Cuscuta epithymum]|uniref:Uncharacterized protein n=1 Tax=Cuscuta epithymum TaxID=186058 RepID=A0AAV0DH80_9ASTE|nr:unnamed protein product [Cuscuta epithymum]
MSIPASISFNFSKLFSPPKNLHLLSQQCPVPHHILQFHVFGCSSKSPDFVPLNLSFRNTGRVQRFKCTAGSESVQASPTLPSGGEEEAKLDDGNSGGNGRFPSGNGGGGEGENEGNDDEDEFGPIMKFEDVMREVEKRCANLPDDMLEIAKAMGLRRLILTRYLDLQIVIDSCCATFAEVQKRGKDFWAEFELYAADLLVGIVVDIALVGMLAPYVRFGKKSVSTGLFGRLQHACGSLPSSVFEAERPGCKFSLQQRVATYFYKGVLYGSVGFVCGLIGQGIANVIMNAKRSIKKSEDDIPVPPLVKSAALWGVFLAISSNTRYQIINGLERVVEASPMAKRIPPVALGFTVGIRFANNIYGGMQFVDWAKLSGVQ